MFRVIRARRNRDDRCARAEERARVPGIALERVQQHAVGCERIGRADILEPRTWRSRSVSRHERVESRRTDCDDSVAASDRLSEARA
jgi:hypothetical protein